MNTLSTTGLRTKIVYTLYITLWSIMECYTTQSPDTELHSYNMYIG